MILVSIISSSGYSITMQLLSCCSIIRLRPIQMSAADNSFIKVYLRRADFLVPLSSRWPKPALLSTGTYFEPQCHNPTASRKQVINHQVLLPSTYCLLDYLPYCSHFFAEQHVCDSAPYEASQIVLRHITEWSDTRYLLTWRLDVISQNANYSGHHHRCEYE